MILFCAFAILCCTFAPDQFISQAYMSAVQTKKTGTLAGQFLIAKASAKNVASRVAFAEARGWHVVASALEQEYLGSPKQKSAVAALGTADLTTLETIYVDFAAAARPFQIPTALSGYRQVPFHTRMIHASTGLTAAFRRPGQPLPASQMSLSSATLEPRRVGGIAVNTVELIRSSNPIAANIVVTDLARAVGDAINRVFLDVSESGSPDSPAGFFFGAPSFPSTGSDVASIDVNLKQLPESLIAGKANLNSAYYIMDESSALHMSMLRTTNGSLAYPEISAKGGRLFGLPVLTSSAVDNENSPGEKIIGLVDSTAVVIADDNVSELDIAEEASIQLDSAPASAAQSLVPLFQMNMVGFRAVRFCNWARTNDGAAAYLSDVHF